jgi:hypothetical protein
MKRRPRARLTLFALAIPGLVALAGCQGGCGRQIHFSPAGDDSLGVHSADSLRAMVRHAQELWESADGGEEGAQTTAIIVREDLQVHPDQPWPGRARALLDSLDFGAEFAADRRVMAVNFFSRSRPDAGAWPWLFWRTPRAVVMRPLAGRDLQLVQVATLPDPGGNPEGWSQVAVLFARRSSAGRMPIVMVWKAPAGESWTPSQTLGPDSLGGVGTVEIATESDTTVVLTSRTFRGMPRFEECATCPHVYALHRFRWSPGGFARIEDRAVPSPYSSFVQFVLALGAGDHDAAARLVSDPALLEQARLFEFNALPKGAWRAAPATDESAGTMVFFRGQQEAYQVSFEPRGEEWLISGIKPTTRTIE